MSTLTEKERQAIIDNMADEAPLYVSEALYPYISEAMEIYANNCIAELRKDEAPSEELVEQIKALMPTEKRMHDFLYEYTKSTCTSEVIGANKLLAFFNNVAIKEIAKLLTPDVNAELLEALNDLYQSLPDGYTDECLVKVKKQLLPYWNERSKLLSQQLEDEEF